jgi:integrase
MRRKTDYLFLRPGSQNWHIKLQSPNRRVEKSLGTPDRRQAEVLAMPLIQEHKERLLQARPSLQVSWLHKYEPGREHAGPDGQRVIATDHELIYLDAKGLITGRAPNGAQAYQFSGGKLTLRSLVEAYIGDRSPFNDEGQKPRAPAVKNSDDDLFETYLRHKKVTGYYEREARDVWALYKSLCGKPLREATRDDGRTIVKYFEGRGLKGATIQKKIGWLTAAVNLAISEAKLKFNPFSAVVAKRDDKQTRLPLDETDMRNIKRNLGRLDASDQVLLRLLATTGMRLSEAFEIDSEMKERGCRYVIVGKKTEQSIRRVPLPAIMLLDLPAIKGPIFEGGPSAASKRLNRFLRDIGITDPRKVAHSLRHRAQDRLRAAGCPEDIRWSILGHEEKTVAAGYGKGFPVPMLRKWIDKIGF